MSNTPVVSAGTAVRELFVYLCVTDAAAAIEFYARVFGARETFRLEGTDGRVGHAELRFGPMTVMISDEHPEHGVLAPATHGASGITLHLHVDDVDQLARRAVEAGAVSLSGPADHPHGERQCRIGDPFGHVWLLGEEIEDLPEVEIVRRYHSLDEQALRHVRRKDRSVT